MLGAYRLIFGKIAPSLPHDPYGHVVHRLKAHRPEEPLFAGKRGDFEAQRHLRALPSKGRQSESIRLKVIRSSYYTAQRKAASGESRVQRRSGCLRPPSLARVTTHRTADGIPEVESLPQTFGLDCAEMSGFGPIGKGEEGCSG
jgi:hypothetical protein